MGGAILIKIVMIFIVLYVSILAIAINYSITFRVKNQIINIIEQYNGYSNSSEAQKAVSDYINSVSFYRDNVKSMAICQNESDAYTCTGNNGYTITKIDSEKGYYYRVTTYVSFDFPILGNFTNFPVSGETRVMYDGRKVEG